MTLAALLQYCNILFFTKFCRCNKVTFINLKVILDFTCKSMCWFILKDVFDLPSVFSEMINFRTAAEDILFVIMKLAPVTSLMFVSSADSNIFGYGFNYNWEIIKLICLTILNIRNIYSGVLGCGVTLFSFLFFHFCYWNKNWLEMNSCLHNDHSSAPRV